MSKFGIQFDKKIYGNSHELDNFISPILRKLQVKIYNWRMLTNIHPVRKNMFQVWNKGT